MYLSNIISRIGVGMAYYGTFGSVSSLVARKVSNEVVGVAVIAASLGLAFILKKTLHITFTGPDKVHPKR